MKIFYFIILISIQIISIFSARSKLYNFDFQDKNSQFFNNICVLFTSESGKDVTLDYRRKYYYKNPNITTEENNDKSKTIFPPPIHNNSLECIAYTKIIFHNYCSYLLFIVLLFETSIMSIYVLFRYKFIEKNSPYELILKKYEKATVNQKKIYLSNFLVKKFDINGNPIDDPSQEPQSSSQKIKGTTNTYANFIDENIENNTNIFADSTKEVKVDNITDLDGKKNCIDDYLINNVDSPAKENMVSNKQSDADFYTFGKLENYKNLALKKIYEDDKASNKILNNKENLKDDNKNIEDKKNIETFVYNKINKNKYVQMSSSYLINKQIQIFYSKEELFYMSFNFLILEDKRNFEEIYKGLLEFCQIYFIFSAPVKIFEDKILIIVYYCIKLELHFLVNQYFITQKQINDIYDNKFGIKNSLYISISSAIISEFIGIFVYYLLNAKRSFIKQKVQIDNLRIYNSNRKERLIQITGNLVTDFLHQKLIALFAFIIIFFFPILKYCISFSGVYRNTRIIYIENIFLSIIISQLSPFFLALFPTYLRIIAIKYKKLILFKLLHIIEYFFLP